MAIAYDHIVPAKKRVISFAHQRLHELKEESNRIQSEIRMWSDMLTGDEAVVHFAKTRLAELKQRADQIVPETGIWFVLLAKMKPCGTCNGKGELCDHIAQDESRFYPCKVCGGKGFQE